VSAPAILLIGGRSIWGAALRSPLPAPRPLLREKRMRLTGDAPVIRNFGLGRAEAKSVRLGLRRITPARLVDALPRSTRLMPMSKEFPSSAMGRIAAVSDRRSDVGRGSGTALRS
jgi:hypothetical protein